MNEILNYCGFPKRNSLNNVQLSEKQMKEMNPGGTKNVYHT